MKIVNTKYFSETGNYFLKNKIYTDAIPGTLEHDTFWTREWDRVMNGYSVGGMKITGDHYFYLNFCPIKRIPTTGNKKVLVKEISLPDFWDGDYEFFWVRDIALNGIEPKEYEKLNLRTKIRHLSGGKHLICGKSRRKGFSFKNASLAFKEYLTKKNSQTLICAFEERYTKDTMNKVIEYSDHLNSIANPSPFSKHRLINQALHIKSGYKQVIGGIETTKGFKSEVQGLTFQDNPDAARGKDPSLVIIEEAGTFANLKSTFRAIQPSLSAGDYKVGQMIIFGTGGDMDYGTIDFNDMFYNPEAYDMLPLENIWDEEQSLESCGFFFPVYLNKEGFIDKNGISDTEGAIQSEILKRETLKAKSKDKSQLTKYVVEQPFNPKEAFSMTIGNIFPAYELNQHMNWLEVNPNVDNVGIRGTMEIDNNGKIIFNKDDDLHECEFPVTDRDKHSGCVVIYEQPDENIPPNLYIAGLDPYAHDNAHYSVSLGSVYIYKRESLGSNTGNRIVASYVGRPSTLNDFNETVRRLLIYYNAKVLHENQINNIVEYFRNKNCLYLLTETPTFLKATINTMVRRTYGTHMNKDIKREIEVYLRDWLLEENREGVPNYKFIFDKWLLKEMIMYNEEGNFDRVISLMMCIMFKIQLTKVSVEQKKNEIEDSFLTRKLFTNKMLR